MEKNKMTNQMALIDAYERIKEFIQFLEMQINNYEEKEK